MKTNNGLVSYSDPYDCVPSDTGLQYSPDYFTGMPDTPATRKIMVRVLTKEQLSTFEPPPRQMGKTVSSAVLFAIRQAREHIRVINLQVRKKSYEKYATRSLVREFTYLCHYCDKTLRSNIFPSLVKELHRARERRYATRIYNEIRSE